MLGIIMAAIVLILWFTLSSRSKPAAAERVRAPNFAEEDRLVEVLLGTNRGELLVAQGALEADGIPAVIHGDRVQDLFGAGSLGTGHSLISGPPRLMVLARDLERAQAVLDRAEMTGN